ncbi:hypothetical protein GCM10023185_09090 [Hymenobacter saemangeumensis]|uniref:CBM-cenC domain-containing protein n=1 Tax=Hymenobacter saemangeumensis TaxID=1084522 RepID=A0ABP8I420_9BACT
MAALLSAGAALGCSKAKPEAGSWVGDIVTTSDFESVQGWVPGASSISRDHARSGRFADRVDASHEFGLTFQLPLAQASVHTLSGLDIEAWTYLSSLEAPATLQVEVWAHGPGQDPAPLYSEGLLLREQVSDSCKWTKVNKRFALRPGMPGEANLRIFLWSRGGAKPVYLDDIRIKALE